MAFFFKLFPDIIADGRLFIAEPPLYRIDDKKDPFVINKDDYINRYVKAASKSYKVGWIENDNDVDIIWMDKKMLTDFLEATSSYVDRIAMMSDHYKINERMLEMILEEFADMNTSDIRKLDIQHLIDRMTIEFPEIYYDDKHKLIRGVIDGKYQLIEISDYMIEKLNDIIEIIREWGAVGKTTSMILKDTRTASENKLSLLGVLKILKKFQPKILHRFKGLGENNADDIKKTIMDPNTRTLIRVHLGDIENDMKIFQLLRGGTPADLLGRKQMMKDFVCPRELIDT